MIKDENDYIDSEDQTLLLIKGNINDKLEAKKYVKTLASALYTVIEKHGSAKLRCVGAAALNHAIKAEIIANSELAKNGTGLVITPSFQTVLFNQTEERTAIVLLVEAEDLD